MLVKSHAGRPPIQDEFTGLYTPQRRKQLRWLRDGLCRACGQPRCEASDQYCLKHWQAIITSKTEQDRELETFIMRKDVAAYKLAHPYDKRRRPFKENKNE